MKILLLGADGQLGRRLRAALAPAGELVALGRHGGPWCGDLTDFAGIADTVRALEPDIIVNAAAYTAVDRAETEPDAAFAVNAQACEVLAAEAQRSGAWLVHYSTDYVFDGAGASPWRESDAPAPLNVYGRSKLAGEEAVMRGCRRHLVLRTSWVFDSRGENFLTVILKAAAERESLDVVADQWGAPTGARLLSQVTAQLLHTLDDGRAGLYHLAAAGETSRHGFAAFALDCAIGRGWVLKAGPADVRAIATAAAPNRARRPLNSRLDTRRLRETWSVALPPWQDGVAQAVAELGMNAYTGAGGPMAG